LPARNDTDEEGDKPPENNSVLRRYDVRFLKLGYFSIVDEEINHEKKKKEPMGREKTPSPVDLLDAFCTPVLLVRAKKHRIPVCDFHITTKADFKLPAVVYPMNPFMYAPSVIRDRKSAEDALNSLSRNHTYPVCVEEMNGNFTRAIVMYGNTRYEKHQKITDKLWEMLGIPVFIAYFMETREDICLSGIAPLDYNKIKRSLSYFKENMRIG
jgi:hypothetical protein